MKLNLRLALLAAAIFLLSMSAVWAEQFSNFALTTLASTIGSTDTTLTVSSTANFPGTTPFRLVLQDSQTSTPEIVMVTAISGNTYTITRGIEGTTATGHSSGAQVAQFVTAGVISNIFSQFPVGAIVGTTDTQTLTNKTISGSSNTLTNLPAANLTGVLPVANGGANVTDISSQLIASSTYSSGNATANAAVINAALVAASNAQRNTVCITAPGVYYTNQIVFYSYENFCLGAGVILRKPPSTVAAMLINEGALQGSPATDTNFMLYGQGQLDGNASNQSGLTRATNGSIPVNTFLYGIRGDISAIGVNNFVVWLTGSPSLYNFQDVAIQYVGTNALFYYPQFNTTNAAIQVEGNSSHIIIIGNSGYSGDDFVALNAWDWHQSSPGVGPITDVKIYGESYYGNSGLNSHTHEGAGLKLDSGTRTTGAGQGVGNISNVSVDGFYINMSSAATVPQSPGVGLTMDFDQPNGAEWAGTGTVQDVYIHDSYMNISSTSEGLVSFQAGGNVTADGQENKTFKNIVFDGCTVDASGTTGGSINGSALNMPFNTVNIQGLEFKHCHWLNGTSTANNAFLDILIKTPVVGMAVKDLIMEAASPSAPTIAAYINQYTSGSATVMNDFTMDEIKTAPGFSNPGPWLYLGGGVINNFRSRGNNLYGVNSGSDGQGIEINSSTSQITGEITDGYFNGVKEGIEIDSGVGSGNAAKLVWQNDQFVNVAHPIFINGASNADMTYIGSSINTTSDLGRISTGSLTTSYSDTTSSGSGSPTTFTLVSGGSVDVRKSDRISLSANGFVDSPANSDLLNWAGTPAYSGVNVISGTGAGSYIYRGTGTTGWLKLN